MLYFSILTLVSFITSRATASLERSIVVPITKSHRAPDHHRRLSTRSSVHQSKLFNDDGTQYLVNIGIGTPMQNFTVSVDTGSSDLWIPAHTCPTDQCPLHRFDPNNSTTFRTDNSSLFQIDYGIGSAQGYYGRDHVYLGTAHVPHQLFGLASSTEDLILLTSSNSREVANGIFGLGHPSLTKSEAQYEPFLFQLAKQGLIQKPIFSISMGPRTHQGWAGELTIGDTNPTKYRGDIAYAPVISNSTYWMVAGKSIKLVKEDTHQETLFNSTFQPTRGMIIDTGTTLTYVDSALANQLVAIVAGGANNVVFDQMSGTYLLNCQAVQYDDPTENYDLHFTLDNNVAISIALRELIIPIDGDTVESSIQCMFGIAPWMTTGTSIRMDEQGWILIGDSVLRSTYLVFDMQENQIGFAKAVPPISPKMAAVYNSSGNRPSSSFTLSFILMLSMFCLTHVLTGVTLNKY